MAQTIETGMAVLKGLQTVMEEIGAIGKNKRNQMQGFNFRGIDDVMNTLHPLMAKAHIIVAPHVLEANREDRVTDKGRALIYSVARMRFDFMSTEDGSTVSVEVVGEGMDSGDKSMNKAMSIALKYACFQLFMIPTEEMADPDAESYQVAPRQQKEQYTTEFVNACKMKAGGTTLGKLYKEDQTTYANLRIGGTEEVKAAIAIIDKEMEKRK